MASNFPTSLDNFSNPTTGDKLDNPSHSGQHGNANDAIEGLETKIGIGASPAGSATAGYAFVHSSGGTTAWSQVGYQGITSGTATSGQVLTAGTATGTTTWSTPTPSGLVLISTTSFSSVSSQPINDVFSATYDHYQIKFQGVASTNISLLMRMRVSGADDSGNNYQANSIFATPASTTINTATGNSAATSSFIPVFLTTGKHLTTIQMSNPFETSATPITYHSWSGDGSGGFNLWGAGRHTGSTSFTGFSLITSSGNITGSVSVYGYAK